MLSKNELKVIKSLKVKKYRMREKRFVVEGTKNVLELLKSDFNVDLVMCSQAFHESFESDLSGVRSEVVSTKILQQAGTFVNNESCLALAHAKDLPIEEVDCNSQIFVLDGVSDPGNMGTIIRTLDWFGFNQLVCSTSCAELYNPKVISSTMGSFTRVKVYYANIAAFIKSCDLPVYGAEMEGESLFELSLKKPSIMVLGSESHGISNQVKNKLDFSVTIPGVGHAESLNVGITAGIIASYLRMP